MKAQGGTLRVIGRNYIAFNRLIGVTSLTCLCSSHESSVPFIILPVHVHMWTLRKCNDHIHVALVTRHYQTCLLSSGEEKDELST